MMNVGKNICLEKDINTKIDPLEALLNEHKNKIGPQVHGLGNASVLNVGRDSNQVASGDHTHEGEKVKYHFGNRQWYGDHTFAGDKIPEKMIIFNKMYLEAGNYMIIANFEHIVCTDNKVFQSYVALNRSRFGVNESGWHLQNRLLYSYAGPFEKDGGISARTIETTCFHVLDAVSESGNYVYKIGNFDYLDSSSSISSESSSSSMSSSSSTYFTRTYGWRTRGPGGGYIPPSQGIMFEVPRTRHGLFGNLLNTPVSIPRSSNPNIVGGQILVIKVAN